MSASAYLGTPKDERRRIEYVADVESLDRLLAERRTIVAQLAPLRAKYGPGGVWDARRKAHRSAVANEIAASFEKAPSEAALERLAAADPRVVELIDHAEREIVAYWTLDNEYSDITARIESRKAEVFFAAQEARA